MEDLIALLGLIEVLILSSEAFILFNNSGRALFGLLQASVQFDNLILVLSLQVVHLTRLELLLILVLSNPSLMLSVETIL